MNLRRLLKSILLVVFLGLPSSAYADEKLEGQTEYEINCMACHQLDLPGVGPSMVAIATTYPADQRDTFVQWAKTPGKKNPGMIQMPSMAHVPDDALARIHSYMLKATVGKEERKKGAQFPQYKEPKRALPYVIRGFLPDSSPASVAVILEGNLSVCWDTEACRLRYAWPGSKTALNSYFGPVKLSGKPFYRETSTALWSIAGENKPEYLGYRLIERAPEFHYRIGDVEIRELVMNGPKKGCIVRRFTVSGLTEQVILDLTHEGGASLESDSGTLQDGKLTLSSAEAKTFTLTISNK